MHFHVLFSIDIGLMVVCSQVRITSSLRPKLATVKLKAKAVLEETQSFLSGVAEDVDTIAKLAEHDDDLAAAMQGSRSLSQSLSCWVCLGGMGVPFASFHYSACSSWPTARFGGHGAWAHYDHEALALQH
jgi:hypothetical protein